MVSSRSGARLCASILCRLSDSDTTAGLDFLGTNCFLQPAFTGGLFCQSGREPSCVVPYSQTRPISVKLSRFPISFYDCNFPFPCLV